MLFLRQWYLIGTDKIHLCIGPRTLNLGLWKTKMSPKHLSCKPHPMRTIILDCLEAVALNTEWEVTCNWWGPFPKAKHSPGMSALSTGPWNIASTFCLSLPSAVQFLCEEGQRTHCQPYRWMRMKWRRLAFHCQPFVFRHGGLGD